jgi:hypothetical protein
MPMFLVIVMGRSSGFLRQMTIVESCAIKSLVRLMKIEARLIPVAVIAAILISPIAARGGSQSHPLGEDAALDLLEGTLKRDRVYEKRISLDCIAYGTEANTNAYFEFVLREIHNTKCGGDRETSPAIDRYRVYRHSGKIQQWAATEDKWQPYRPPVN